MAAVATASVVACPVDRDPSIQRMLDGIGGITLSRPELSRVLSILHPPWTNLQISLMLDCFGMTSDTIVTLEMFFEWLLATPSPKDSCMPRFATDKDESMQRAASEKYTAGETLGPSRFVPELRETKPGSQIASQPVAGTRPVWRSCHSRRARTELSFCSTMFLCKLPLSTGVSKGGSCCIEHTFSTGFVDESVDLCAVKKESLAMVSVEAYAVDPDVRAQTGPVP